MRVPPVVPAPHPEAAVYSLNLLSATGTSILLAALVSGFVMRYSPWALLREYGRTFYAIRYSLMTIAAMLALGFVTYYGVRCPSPAPHGACWAAPAPGRRRDPPNWRRRAIDRRWPAR